MLTAQQITLLTEMLDSPNLQFTLRAAQLALDTRAELQRQADELAKVVPAPVE